MSQLNTPFTYWNANPFHKLKAVEALCTKNFDNLIVTFKNGVIWIFKIINKSNGKKEFMPTLCLLGHETTVTALTLVKLNVELSNDDENAIISISEDGTVITWDLNDGHCILKQKQLFNEIITSIQVTKSRKYLICSGYSCDIYILSVDTLEIKQIININNDWISAMKLRNETSELYLTYESGEMSIFKFDEIELNLINEETKSNNQTIPKAIQICINEYNNDIFFVLSRDICLMYSKKLNIELPILKIVSPQGHIWKKGKFLSSKTFILWTTDSKIFVYYIGQKSELSKVNENQISEVDDSNVILFSNSESHIITKKSNLELELMETNNPYTLIGEFSTSINPHNPFDEADVQCMKSNNSTIHIISVQNINNSASISYWSFYSYIDPSKYVTYHRKKSIDTSNSNNTDSFPIQAEINTPTSSIEDVFLTINPFCETQLEELWNVKFDNYPKKSLVTAVTSFSSLFIIFGYESGMIKVMPLYYPFLYDINSLSESENEVFTLNGHSSRVVSLFVPKKINSNGKLLLFSSSTDASTIIWDLETGKQLYKYNEYTRAVAQFVQVPKEKEGDLLQNCVIAFSDDNSISIFNLEKLECIYHFTGHNSEVSRLSWKLDGDYICVQCIDKSVSVWHLKSNHLDRIITDPYYSEQIIDNCDVTIKFNPFNTDYSKLNNKQILSIFPVYFIPYGQIPVIVFYINIKQLINEINYFHRMSNSAYSSTPGSPKKIRSGRSSPENGSNKTSKQLGISLMLKSSHFKGIGNPNGKSLSNLYRRFTQLLFSSLLTWEIDTELDNICVKKIGLKPNRKNITIGIKGVENQFSLLAPFSSDDQVWKISPLYTASRLIKILSFVPIFSAEKGNEDDVVSIITHYGIMLSSIVGPDYNYPSFSHLTKYWLDSTNDIQQAARCLYRSTLSKITEKELNRILNYWEPYLIIDDPKSLTKISLRAAMLLGIIGADENELLKSNYNFCSKISKALLLIIENKTSLQHRIAAVELIGKGFLVWEPHINGSAVIRLIMSLANLGSNSTNNSTNTSPTNSIISSKASINNNTNSTSNINTTSTPSVSQSLKGQLNRQLTQKANLSSNSTSATMASNNSSAIKNGTSSMENRSTSFRNKNDIHTNSTTADNLSQSNSARARTNSNHSVSSAMNLTARQALIQIATYNTPLFITTLTFDLVHSKNIYERQSGLQLLSLFINKKPLIIYPYLSKIVEAVVKSLDPNVPNMRENMIQSVTLSLHDLVKKFPNIAFHGNSQRIAIGSIEGLILIYDLKTGTRWQILEGHQKPVTAVSFSPDGKLIASYSLEEALVRIWQPSPSFLGMLVGTFNSSDNNNAPMKSIRSYSVGTEIKGENSENTVSLNAIIENVRFEWTSENKVKLIGLRGSAMNVSV
ncbi:hypothetical protein BCR36DRAFT_585180 [Piromyces finnis]|uniref:WD40 repeat-like protein n=1 Tax=Piromyces finnis TaxID=1754191 RepID=A0A1Y1V5A3_9FUNG|nr:hypothetical protein BCR36DRAFT_585180 [Piromyces finnis]|eukprot:ORX46362.1 hypothetical protein BCR36DRAFT_585180 [Piromyces finnis]